MLAARESFRVKAPVSILFAFLFVAITSSSASANVFVNAPDMNSARADATMNLLSDGKVLVAGGADGSGGGSTASAEIYDPVSNTFSATGSMDSRRYNHTGVTLQDGRVLLAGGIASGSYLSSAEIYDPDSGTFSAAGSMNLARGYASAFLLPDGKVLVAGGANSGGALASAEVYNPATNTFSLVGAMNTSRYAAALVSTASGPMIAGGNGGGSWLSSSSVYSASGETFSSGPAMQQARDYAVSVPLPGGRTLIAGGYKGPSSNPANSIADAEVYDPGVGVFSLTGSMNDTRAGPRGALLPDGRALIMGGSVGNDVIVRSSAELYDPYAGTFSYTGSMSQSRTRHTAIALRDGRVLVVGGTSPGPGFLKSAELYLSPVPLYVLVSGQGTVVSDPSLISCPGTCEGYFQSDSIVALEAAPADGFYLAGWSGSCSGRGDCQISMSGEEDVEAVFARFSRPSLRRYKKAGKASLRVMVGCGSPDGCSIRLRGLRRLKQKTGDPNGKTRTEEIVVRALRGKTVRLLAGESKVVRLFYTNYLRMTVKRGMRKEVSPKIRIRAREVGERVKIISVRVRPGL